MSLTLLPSLDLSSAQELLKIEVTCTGRPVSRPALPSQASFVSSCSTSTDTSTLPRKSRPSLSPEALLAHAFGPSALSRLSAPSLPIPACTTTSGSQYSSSSSSSSSTCSSSCGSSRSRRKRSSFPVPPPPGTFRSVAKPTKNSSIQPSLSELKPLQVHGYESTGEKLRDMPSRECERVANREPLMSPIQWREKAEERLQRRKILRHKAASQVANLPLEIDCRPMEGSMGFPPASDLPKARRPKMNERNFSSPALAVNSASSVKKEVERLLLEEEKTAIKEELDRPKSMIEMKEIEDLVEQCDAACLKD